MERSKLLAVIVAVSVLGFTLTPLAYLPCCCKNKPACTHAKAAPSCCASAKAVKSCCNTANTVLPCHLNNTFKPVCPNCRCLEQFQRTALPGQNVDEATFRVALAAVDSFAAGLLPGTPRDVRDVHRDTGSSGASILLKTCTLLC